MIGLVLVTHGRLAAEFVRAMEHVVGPQERIEAICIGPEDDMEVRRNDIADAIAKVDAGTGVIILTDLPGAPAAAPRAPGRAAATTSPTRSPKSMRARA